MTGARCGVGASFCLAHVRIHGGNGLGLWG